MRGKTEYENGHIPRAINVPAAKLQNEDNTYKTLAERKEIFVEHGVDLSKPMAFNCGGGIKASVGYHLAEGLTDAKR
eukprot:CAMPEP_0116881270 /NCGR_PEP_ID=MMETSP0463-20121206/13389_1 /TAXON_ID=181622 /ORGANISM="Strombidinopsis sp, Strain SopsisLIS2011" /LENGTH=76 /DNA_ID=CAMNT_0004533061 /DNA_START=549 /DNA_END=779 /DNA_ORIENTATION=+